MKGTIASTVASIALVWFVSCVPATAQSLRLAQDPTAGSRVFGTRGCVKCHAVNGVGGTVGPDLGRISDRHSFFDLAASLWNHLPRMAGRMRQLGIVRPRLDEKETGDLIAFLYTLNYFDPKGDARAGERLFTDKQCIVCHQVGSSGGVVGPALDFVGQYGSPIFVAAALWNHGPAMSEAMRERGIDRPTFKGAEILDLIEYLKTASMSPVSGPLHVLPGRAERGARLFTDKRCAECHSASGRGGRVGPDLAERGVGLSLTQFAAAMWNKAPAMTAAMGRLGLAIPHLEADEMADLVAYLYSVRYFAVRGEPTSGAKVLATSGCLACHGRGKVATDLTLVRGLDSPAKVIAGLWNHSFIDDARADRGRDGWRELRAQDMADLVSYLGFTRTAR